jgi:predicted membrane-bound spermidine synthase
MQFCLANALLAESLPPTSGGTLYAADLWGSALGALLLSALLVPLWGIPKSLLLLTFINLAAWLLLVVFVKEKNPKTETEYRIERRSSCKSP